MSDVEKITISIQKDVLKDVDARGDNRSGTISRDLDRYYTLLKRARVSLADKFSPDEVGAVVEAISEAMTDGKEIQKAYIWVLYAHVEEAIKIHKLDEKWKIDGSALIEKLRELSFSEACALVDGSERRLNKETET